MSAFTSKTVAEHPAVERLARDVTLAEGARSGGVWLAVSSLGTQAVQFAASIVMARLLMPRQFGETALVYAIAAFATIFTDLGLTAAIVHARRVTEELLSSAFWLSLISGLALTLLVSGLAVPVSQIYAEPQLAGLLIVVSLNFTFSCGAVQLALLERTFNFRRIAIIEAGSTVVGTCVMPIAVLLGFGVYSIVLGPLVTTCLLSASLWVSVRWLPKQFASRAEIRELWAFSRGLVGFNAVNYWSRNLDNLLLGGAVSAAKLGEYNRSYNLMMISVGQIGGVLMRGLYPALARMRDDPARMGRAWVRAVAAATGSLSLPLTLTMAATAPALVEVLYGPRWAGATPLLELLSLAAVPQILAAAAGGPYRAVGRTGLMFKLSLVATACAVVAIVIGLRWGATGVAAAILINSWITVPIVIGPLMRTFGIPVGELLRPMLAAWAPSLAIVGGELAVRLLIARNAAALEVLALQLLVGAVVYGITMWRSNSEVAQAMRARFAQVSTLRQRLTSRTAP